MLERLMGDVELAGTILRGFLADMPRQIEALRALAYELEQAGKAGEYEKFRVFCVFRSWSGFYPRKEKPHATDPIKELTMPLTQSRS